MNPFLNYFYDFVRYYLLPILLIINIINLTIFLYEYSFEQALKIKKL